MTDQTAFIAGATGLVGRELVRHLLTQDYYRKIKILTRSDLPAQDDRLEVIKLKDFDKIPDIRDRLEASDYYCTLGTTIKQAGSRQIFDRVDRVYPKMIADVAISSPSFRQYLVVTAAGAKPDSPLFYNQVKGQLEQELQSMGLRSLKIFRPSLLLGSRSKRRIGEEIAKFFTKVLSFFLLGMNKGLISIHGRDVARAMFAEAKRDLPGSHVYKSSDIYKIAKREAH